MDNSERKIGNRKEKIKNWLKDPYNLIFIGILILAIIIRLYYFSLTKGQPLWWDEADYLSYAKNLAGFPVEWIITAQHNSFYPYFAAIIFKFGLGELGVKFLLQIMPSVLTVVLVYFISVEMYKDKRIALISMFLMATFWVVLFNTMRFHIDIIALFIGFLAIYVFWKGYENKERVFGKINPKWAIPITVFLVVLTYSIRRGYFLFGAFFLIYMLMTRNWVSLFKDKYNWIGFIGGLVLFFLVEKTIFISNIGSVSQSYFYGELPINFLPLKVFSSYFISSSIWTNFLLYLFWFGVIVLSFSIFLSFGYIKKTKTKVRADLFNIIAIVITLAFFIVVLRSPDNFGEPRWYLPLALGAFICISKSTLLIIDHIKPYSKHIAVVTLVLIIGFGGYYEVKSADNIIKNRINSYEGTRQAGLFLKEISSPNEKIITLGQPQIEYYSERGTHHPKGWVNQERNNEYPFEIMLEKIRENPDTKYIVVSFLEPNPPYWMRREIITNGQLVGWEIPFMNTTLNFVTGNHDIKQSLTYEDITFNIINTNQDVFIYEIDRGENIV